MKKRDLLNIDVSKLTKADVEKIGKQIIRQSNIQLSYWKKQKYQSPAARRALKSVEGDNFYINPKQDTLNRMKKVIRNAQIFLSDRTATAKGWKEVKRDMVADIKKTTGGEIKLTIKNFDAIWTAYEKAREKVPAIEKNENKYRAVKEIAQLAKNGKLTTDNIALKIINDYTKQYQREEEQAHDTGTVSKFFKN